MLECLYIFRRQSSMFDRLLNYVGMLHSECMKSGYHLSLRLEDLLDARKGGHYFGSSNLDMMWNRASTHGQHLIKGSTLSGDYRRDGFLPQKRHMNVSCNGIMERGARKL